MSQYHHKILRIIAHHLRLPEERLSPTMTLEDLGLNSLTAAEVLLSIEKELQRTIDSAQLGWLLTRDTPLAQLIEAIEAGLRSGQPAGASEEVA